MSDPRDRIDGYSPPPTNPTAPLPAKGNPWSRIDKLDGYENALTAVGTSWGDKTKGGREGALHFRVVPLTAPEIEARWEGDAIAARIVEAIPGEMCREGYDLQLQLVDEEEASEPAPTLREGIERQAEKLEGQGNTDAADALRVLLCDLPAERLDADEEADDETVITEALAAKAEAIGLDAAFNLALEYETAYGGAGILIGYSDEANISLGMPLRLDEEAEAGYLMTPGMAGVAARVSGVTHLDAADPSNLTAPLDPKRVGSVTHLNVFTGGWDGELIGYRFFGDQTKPNYGMPEIYMLRNIGVPTAGPAAPGEPSTAGKAAYPGVRYVHHSRLIIFPGKAPSPRVRMRNRGWGSGIFNRVDETLSRFGQTWGAVAIIMQEFSVATLAMAGLRDLITSNTPEEREVVQQRAKALQMSMSICGIRLIDADEKYERQNAPLTGVSDVLHEFVYLLAAAADQPVALLMGQSPGGLGDAASTDVRFFNDRVKQKQKLRMAPQLRQVHTVLFLAGDSPTGRVLPKRWAIIFRSLSQMSPKEEADLDKTIVETDAVRVTNGFVTAPEVTAARYAGAKFNRGPIAVDMEARRAMAATEPESTNGEANAGAGAPGGGAPAGGHALELTPTVQGAIVKVNQALAALSLPPLTFPDGTPNPDGELTIAAFTAKHSAVVSAAENAQAGTATSDTPPTEGEPAASTEEEEGASAEEHGDAGPAHAPAGSPTGGQFVAAGGGSGGGAAAKKPRQSLARKGAHQVAKVAVEGAVGAGARAVASKAVQAAAGGAAASGAAAAGGAAEAGTAAAAVGAEAAAAGGAATGAEVAGSILAPEVVIPALAGAAALAAAEHYKLPEKAVAGAEKLAKGAAKGVRKIAKGAGKLFHKVTDEPK